MRIVIGSTFLATALWLFPALAKEPAPTASASPAPAIALSPTTANDLRSGNPAKIRAALDDARMAGKGAASVSPIISDLLARGLPAPLTEAAIDTLGDIGNESAAVVLASYARHRTLKIRQAAVRALLKIKYTHPAVAEGALRRGLTDPDPMIRGLSATGLGTLKAKEALPDLTLALAHRVNEAAAAIGQICVANECDVLTAKLGGIAFEVVTSGLDQVLSRADINDDAKLKVIGRVRELGTSDANQYLRELQKRPGFSGRIKQAIDQAVQATGGGS